MRPLVLVVAALIAACAAEAEGEPGSGTGTGTGTAQIPEFADAAPVAVPEAAPVLDGADFTSEAQMLFVVAACGEGDLPPHVDAAIVETHCRPIREQMRAYRKKYVEGGRAFFEELVPDGVPKVVVYPFGGGDLISALVAFPDADEITTISLELAGDPRRVATIDAARLERSLAALRVEIGGTLQVGSNTSENLSASQDDDLPAQVSSFLMGLAATGFEPVGMRYLRLREDGSIDYLDEAEIAAIDRKAKRRKVTWTSPNFSEAFAHVEIRYRRRGEDRVRVHRHFGWNLADDALRTQPELLRHLERKGKVTMMTKGASYLLWLKSFSTIRNYLLANLAWMVSDSTGVPPAYATKAGMVQETWGTFHDAFLPHARGTRHARDFAALWARSPKRKLPFRFGYIDAHKSAHLVVTRPAAP